LNSVRDTAFVVAMPTISLNSATLRSAVERHMPGLDGLRGLAVLVIVWHNVTGVGGGIGGTVLAKVYFAAAAAGWVGVTLFFALSGFLITGILLDTRTRPHAWRTFTARRALRIFPLYYAVLAVTFILQPLMGGVPSWLVPDQTHQVWYWTYLVNWSEPFGRGGQGFAHFWSLAVEEQFYLLWPLLVLSVGARRLAALSALLVLVALGSRIWILNSSWDPVVASKAVYSFTICRWDALTLGAIVAVAARDRSWAAVLIRLLWPGTLVLLASVLALGAWRHGYGSRDWAIETVGQSIVAALSATVIALAISPGFGAPAACYRTLGHPALRAVGKYSYAIYVFHFPLTHAVVRWLPKAVINAGGLASVAMFTATFIAVFAVSFAVALVSWRLLEQPALGLRRYLNA
jgi:peptidoglycan/LPS O-acetylase OafA/YrhL